MDFRLILLGLSSFSFICVIHYSLACNEAVCASIVSKCMITQSCKCDLQNCSCCKDCFNCLHTLYSECCSCVDMCPKPNHTKTALSKQSHVEDLSDPIPSLFQSLVAEPDTLDRWFTLTFPIDFKNIGVKKESVVGTSEQQIDPLRDIVTLNCSVAYMSQCMPWTKCKTSCQSMGANSYRWFHDGCCECVGDKCVNYGISESRYFCPRYTRCTQCPAVEIIQPNNIDQLTYGEDIDDLPQ